MSDNIPDDLPEPLRAMIAAVRAAGGKVAYAPVADAGGIKAGVIKLTNMRDGDFLMPEGVYTQGHEKGCTCLWCDTNRDLRAIQDADELTWEQKFEALDLRLDKAVDAVKAEGADAGKLFNLRIQQLKFNAHAANRRWLITGVESRIHSIVKVAAELAGVDPDAPPEQIIGSMPTLLEATLKPGADAETTVKHAMTALLLKDMLRMHDTIETELPTFYVTDSTDPAALGREL